MIENRKSVASASESLKRKLESDDSSSNEVTSEPQIVVKTPTRRKHPESNSPELKSNKRAKLTPLAKQQPAHEMSDSDDNDSLTKLNTTLNKSMALMENKSEIVTLNKSRKSVSINTKLDVMHTPNESRTQKSILKKPAAQVAANENGESSSDTQEQTVQEILQPINIVTPKIIRRPINLENLIHQENLSYDNTKASFSLDDVSDDDEIYILEVPKTVDPRELEEQVIKLRGKNKLRIGDQLYETSTRDGTNISCIFRTDEEQSSYQTVNLRPAGCIYLRKKLSKSLHIELSSVGKKTVPFPEKLKIRHPLFGAEYEDKIIITNGKKVPKQISRSVIKREASITRTNEKSNEIEKKPIKLKNVEKSENRKTELSEEVNESENNSKAKFQRSLQLDGSDSASSDSDTDGSFFQKVKLKRLEKYEKRKISKTVSSDLDLDETTSIMNINFDETVIDVKQKNSAVNNRKLGSSLNSSVLKNNSFLLDEKDNQFFSSTPIKIENDEKKNTESEILTNKVRKRKTSDGISKLTKTPKKVKETNLSMPAFQKKKSNVSI